MSSLTRQQRAFAAAKARLGNGRGTGLAAAREAGYRGTDGSLKVTASRLGKDPRVRAEIAQIRAAALAPGQAPPPQSRPRAVKAVALTLARKRELLAEIAESADARDSDRIRAIELDAKLVGELGGDGAGDVAAVAAAAQASASATVVVWVGNGRGPAPPGAETTSG